MNIPQLLLAFFLYMMGAAVLISFAACVIAGRSDDEALDGPNGVECESVTYALPVTQDKRLALS